MGEEKQRKLNKIASITGNAGTAGQALEDASKCRLEVRGWVAENRKLLDEIQSAVKVLNSKVEVQNLRQNELELGHGELANRVEHNKGSIESALSKATQELKTQLQEEHDDRQRNQQKMNQMFAFREKTIHALTN